MIIELNRRALLLTGAASAILSLPGCASMGGFSLTEAIRRLLSLASQDAFAMLLKPGGFYDSNVSRIELPERFGGISTGGNAGVIVSAVLQSSAFRDRLQRQLNRAAEKGAERAAPLVADAVRNVSIQDAAAIVRGEPFAATRFLRDQMGPALVDAMLPGIAEGLRLFDDKTISRAVQLISGYDIGSLAKDVNDKADNAIWSAIGYQEAAIRANPQKTGDPVLIGVFGLLK